MSSIRPPAPPRKVTRLPAPRRVRLVLDLDDTLAARLDEAIGVVVASRAVLELGVPVDRARVARIALVRGLDAITGDGFEPEVAAATCARPVRAARPGSAGDDPGGLPDGVRPDGTLVVPAGWTIHPENERIPVYQQDVHAHYEEHGWDRYLVFTGEKDWVYAYWCDRLDGQPGVTPFPGAQVIHLGDQGTAHVIPGTFGKES